MGRFLFALSHLDCHTLTATFLGYHSEGSFQRDNAGAGHSCHRFRLHDRRAPFPSPDPLGALGLPGIVSFHSHRNLQDLNLRSLPLSVKRRIPPRPRFRMPPSIPGCQLLGLRSIRPHGRRKAVPLPRRIARGPFSRARRGAKSLVFPSRHQVSL